MTKPNEPTLTCSEVVERLAGCAKSYFEDQQIIFDREKATAILNEWRERRVQELEDCLRGADRVLFLLKDEVVALGCGADRLAANVKEQIRKGAKHE